MARPAKLVGTARAVAGGAPNIPNPSRMRVGGNTSRALRAPAALPSTEAEEAAKETILEHFDECAR